MGTLTPIEIPGIPVKGQWSMWTTGDGHGLSYPGGAFRKDLLEGYMDTMNIFTHGASKNVIPEVKDHEKYGPWWYNLTACRDPSNQSVAPGCHYGAVKWPVV